MLSAIYLSMTAATSAPNLGVVVDGTAFGPRQTLTCEWFTNFENSRFEQCRAAGRSLLPPNGGGASLKCIAQSCEQLDTEGRRVANWRKPEPPWGTFNVRLISRVGVGHRAKRYLGDGTKTVLIEEILSVSTGK